MPICNLPFSRPPLPNPPTAPPWPARCGAATGLAPPAAPHPPAGLDTARAISTAALPSAPVRRPAPAPALPFAVEPPKTPLPAVVAPLPVSGALIRKAVWRPKIVLNRRRSHAAGFCTSPGRSLPKNSRNATFSESALPGTPPPASAPPLPNATGRQQRNSNSSVAASGVAVIARVVVVPCCITVCCTTVYCGSIFSTRGIDFRY